VPFRAEDRGARLAHSCLSLSFPNPPTQSARRSRARIDDHASPTHQPPPIHPSIPLDRSHLFPPRLDAPPASAFQLAPLSFLFRRPDGTSRRAVCVRVCVRARACTTPKFGLSRRAARWVADRRMGGMEGRQAGREGELGRQSSGRARSASCPVPDSCHARKLTRAGRSMAGGWGRFFSLSV
jgi:hypothetical protein